MYEALTLRPPFQANDMESLFKKVMIGKYQQIPNVYSQDLAGVIKSMIQVNSKLRPTCITMLNMESIKKRIEKYFGADYLFEERNLRN